MWGKGKGGGNGEGPDFRRESLGEIVTCTIGERVFIQGKIPQEQWTCKVDGDKNVEIHIYLRKGDLTKASIKSKKPGGDEPRGKPQAQITGDTFAALLSRRPDIVERIKAGEQEHGDART